MIEGARAEIDLTAITKNLATVRAAAPGRKVMAVIKADAYGHGAEKVAKHLTAVDALAVARIGEAVALRQAGIDRPLVVMEGIFDAEGARLAEALDLDLVVHAPYQAALIKKATCKVWLKVETGMNRLGLTTDQLATCLQQIPEQRILGLMSHLSDADAPEKAKNGLQLNRLMVEADRYGLPTCLGNSASILGGSAGDCDWVRPGLMLYGVSPLSGALPPLHPAMSLKAPVIAVKSVPAGATIGYGSTWTAPDERTVAVLAIGYADGYPREIKPGTEVWLGQREQEILGRVSMDMTVISTKDGDVPQIGEEAELWGLRISVAKVAAAAHTLSYVLLSGLSHRVLRSYRE